MILSLTTSRRLLLDLAVIRQADKVDELKERIAAAHESLVMLAPGTDHRPDAALLTSLMGYEYEATISLAAMELGTREATTQRVIQQLANELRKGAQ